MKQRIPNVLNNTGASSTRQQKYVKHTQHLNNSETLFLPVCTHTHTHTIFVSQTFVRRSKVANGCTGNFTHSFLLLPCLDPIKVEANDRTAARGGGGGVGKILIRESSSRTQIYIACLIHLKSFSSPLLREVWHTIELRPNTMLPRWKLLNRKVWSERSRSCSPSPSPSPSRPSTPPCHSLVIVPR